MSLTRDETIYSSMFFPEKRLDETLYYYYEPIPLSSCQSSSQGEANDRSTCEPNNFDCLSFMDFSQDDKQSESHTFLTEKSCFSKSLFQDKPRKLFYTYKREKKQKLPAMICDFENCGMAFRHRWIFEKHLATHQNGRFFRCHETNCNKMYKSKENLNLHIKNIHEGIKPYQCKYCEMKFSHRNGKTYHERKFHNNFLPHVCELSGCVKAFASRSALNYHLNNQHSN